MSDAVLRGIIKAAVVLLFVLLVAGYRFIRASSPRAKKWLIGSVIGLVLLVVAYGTVRGILRKRSRPLGLEDVAGITALVREERGRIEQVRRNLSSLRELVSTGMWIPDGERSCERTEGTAPLYFAFDLRGAEHPQFGDPASDLDDLDDLVSWAEDPDRILRTWRWQTPERLAGALSRADAPLAYVAELVSVTPPEVRNLRFQPDKSVTGEVVPGRVVFRLGVVEVASGRVLAYGGGEARTRENLGVPTRPDELRSDLREQTRRAAAELGRRLTGTD